jgi:hypothetical protein
LLAVVGGSDEHFGNYPCRVNRKVAGSRSVIIPGAPHGIMDRKEVREALDTFLRECCQ